MRELSLLPPSRRFSQRQEQQFLIIGDILSAFILSLGIMTAVGLTLAVSFWIMIQSIPELSELPQQIQHYQQIKTATNERNAVLESLAQISADHIVWASFLASMIGSMNPDIHLDQILADGVSKKMTIIGRAESRNALIILESRLKAVPGIATLSSPPSNLLIRQNPPFTFDITLDPTNIPKDAVDSTK